MTFDLKAETQKLADALEGMRLAGLTMSSEPAQQVIALTLAAASVGLDTQPSTGQDARPALTQRQRELVEVVVEYTRENGYPPTIREIGSRMGIGSSNGVVDTIRRITLKGYLARDEHKSRSIRAINWPTQGAERTGS